MSREDFSGVPLSKVPIVNSMSSSDHVVIYQGGLRRILKNLFASALDVDLQTLGFVKSTSFISQVKISATVHTANFSASNTDNLLRLDSSGGAFTVTLPDPVSMYNSITNVSAVLTFKRVDTSANSAFLTAYSGQNIDNDATDYELSGVNEPVVQIFSDGTNYWTITS